MSPASALPVCSASSVPMALQFLLLSRHSRSSHLCCAASPAESWCVFSRQCSYLAGCFICYGAEGATGVWWPRSHSLQMRVPDR